MMTLQEDSVKLDSEATGIPGPASFSFIGDNSESKPLGLFLYLLWNSPFQACFPILGAVNTLLAQADPAAVQEGLGCQCCALPSSRSMSGIVTFSSSRLCWGDHCFRDICHVTTLSTPSQELQRPCGSHGKQIHLIGWEVISQTSEGLTASPGGHWRRRWQPRETWTGGRNRRLRKLFPSETWLGEGRWPSSGFILVSQRGIFLCFPWERTSGLSFLIFVQK